MALKLLFLGKNDVFYVNLTSYSGFGVEYHHVSL